MDMRAEEASFDNLGCWRMTSRSVSSVSFLGKAGLETEWVSGRNHNLVNPLTFAAMETDYVER